MSERIPVTRNDGRQIGVIEKTAEGYQPLHEDGGIGPVFETESEARDYMLEEQE